MKSLDLCRGKLLAALLLTGTLASAQTAAPASGVAQDLARARATMVSDIRYEVSLSIPANKDAPISGHMVLRFLLSDRTRPLVLDFEPDRQQAIQLKANGVPAVPVSVNGHLVLPAASLRRGENELEIEFTAGDGPLNRSDDQLFTVFVPAQARRAIPCFDQPDLKARWSITLEHPAPWLSVANGAELERVVVGDRARVRFGATKPISTYLVSFVAGALRMETGMRDGRMLRMFHRETDAAKLIRNREEIFDLHARSLAHMAEYTNLSYPFEKYDFVLLPTFPFPGMEHVGATAYNSEELMLEESATQRERLWRARLIAHEVAHAWFGNLVTMRWFDDVWTKEVFASFMASKIADPLFPDVRHDLAFFVDNHLRAYPTDRSAGTHPIRQPLGNLADAADLYSNLIYAKAPVVMRQLEVMLGEQEFRDGLRTYLRRHSYANATWDDLISALAPRARFNLREWSRVWIDEPGRPSIRTELRLTDGRLDSLRLIETAPRGRKLRWPQELRITLLCSRGQLDLRADMQSTRVDLTRDAGNCLPDAVLAGGQGWAYADFQFDERSRRFLAENLSALQDPLTRAVAWSGLWEAMLAGRMTPQAVLPTLLAALRSEGDEQVASYLLGDLGTLWWRFLTPQQRVQAAGELETLLRQRLADAADAPRKSVWFKALQSLAVSSETVSWLRLVWKRDAAVAGLPLSEADETRLARELARRDVVGSSQILDEQIERIANPDRKARMTYLREVLSPSPAQREAWFRQLRDPAKRKPEEWVIDGLSELHHPVRAETSAQLVQPALEMLLDVRRHGGTFFDSQWVDSVLHGHGSPATAAVVQRYLAAQSPDFPLKLRERVLQAGDLLQRAARVRSKGPL
ncbi:M1 family aminopeptidase [Aquabacterium humicola]|uniref:M1 family aminopeptidase n=1 Tax=Aquabacterium humicola TaxID=3237377 RepID=UPI0025431594|nr:M1 family aminopeptidase [Rubrivivax pictus]